MKAISTNKRIFVKCLSQRFISIIFTILIVWIVTGSIDGALSIGFLDFFVKLGLYFGHEKAWKLTDWGKIYVD